MATYGKSQIVAPRHDSFVGSGFVALTSLVGLTGAGSESRTTWIHVAPFGEWAGHSAGKFTLAKEHFAAVCAQVANKRTPVSLDYEHASIRPDGGPTPAAGYVLSTEIRSDGLWAQVEFTPRAAEMIRGGEYRFCSGVFDFAARDNATGEELLCALDTIALTNRPFIDGQHPIALSRRVPLSAGVSMEIDLKALAKLLDAIPGPNTADKVRKAIDLMSSGDKPADAGEADVADASAKPVEPVALNADAPAAPAVALGDAAPAAALADPAPMPMADAPPPDAVDDSAVDEFDAKMMGDLGLDVDAYAALLMEKYDAIKSLLMGSDAAASVAMSRDLVVSGLKSQLESITKERNELRGKLDEQARVALTAEVDALVKRVPSIAAARDSWLALARSNPVEFRKAASNLAPAHPALTSPQAVALAQPTKGAEHLESEAKAPLPADDARVVALTKSLTAAGLKPDSVAFKNAIKNLAG